MGCTGTGSYRYSNEASIAPSPFPSSLCVFISCRPIHATPYTITRFGSEGYTLAAHMLEVHCGKDYEALIRERP